MKHEDSLSHPTVQVNDGRKILIYNTRNDAICALACSVILAACSALAIFLFRYSRYTCMIIGICELFLICVTLSLKETLIIDGKELTIIRFLLPARETHKVSDITYCARACDMVTLYSNGKKLTDLDLSREEREALEKWFISNSGKEKPVLKKEKK